MDPKQANRALSLDRFVSLSTLLSRIDPVRGPPTAHMIEGPEDSISLWASEQKKFLESFAIICSTEKKGKNTATAVCLEHNNGPSTTLRLARNGGVSSELAASLDLILNDLRNIARQGHVQPKDVQGILARIIELDIEKIHDLASRFLKPVNANEMTFVLMPRENRLPGEAGIKFKNWIAQVPTLLSLPTGAAASLLAPLVTWASHARWTFGDQIQSLLPSTSTTRPNWLLNIHKIGRYHAAALAMIKLAQKQPAIFESIHVEAVDAACPQFFSLAGTKPLSSLLKKLKLPHADQLVAKLGNKWDVSDPEADFRLKCRMHLTVHAEMQLLSFYDQHPGLAPDLRFMGTSKKACYLCHQFIQLHPLAMSVSACHQKIYPTWMPVFFTEPYSKKGEFVLQRLCDRLESTAAHSLQYELDSHRPPNLDSSAGPSLTFISGLTLFY
jgi:hypothetical protein